MVPVIEFQVDDEFNMTYEVVGTKMDQVQLMKYRRGNGKVCS